MTLREIEKTTSVLHQSRRLRNLFLPSVATTALKDLHQLRQKALCCHIAHGLPPHELFHEKWHGRMQSASLSLAQLPRKGLGNEFL